MGNSATSDAATTTAVSAPPAPRAGPPPYAVSCTLDIQPEGRLGTLCRVDVTELPTPAVLVAAVVQALALSCDRLLLVRPRSAKSALGRVVLLLVGATREGRSALLLTMPFLRAGSRGASLQLVDEVDAMVLSTDLFAVPTFVERWNAAADAGGHVACSVRGPVHLALLRQPAQGVGPLPPWVLVFGESHDTADGCPAGLPAPADGSAPLPCVSGLHLLNCATEACTERGVHHDLFVETMEGKEEQVPSGGAASLIAVVERRYFRCYTHGTRGGPGCPPTLRVHAVDGRFREPAWTAILRLAGVKRGEFDRLWREVGGEAGMLAAIAGLSFDATIRPDERRAAVNRFLGKHGMPLLGELPGAASRLQLAIDLLREQGTIDRLGVAFASAGPLPVSTWRSYLLAFVVELEAIATWLDARVSGTSHGVTFVAGGFHTRRMVQLYKAMGMEPVFEYEFIGGKGQLSTQDVESLAAVCGIDPGRLLELGRRPQLPRPFPQAEPSRHAVTGVVVAGCADGFWVVSKGDPLQVWGLVLHPGRGEQIAAMLDPYFLHLLPHQAARLGASANGLDVVGVACCTNVDTGTERPKPAFSFDPLTTVRAWASHGLIEHAVEDLQRGDAVSVAMAIMQIVARREGRAFPLVFADLDRLVRFDLARVLEEMSGGRLTTPWGPDPDALTGRGWGWRRLAPTAVARGAAGVLLPVPAGCDLSVVGVLPQATFPAAVGSQHQVPWELPYPAPDVILQSPCQDLRDWATETDEDEASH